MTEKILDTIKDAEYVFVGIGEGFGYDWSLIEKDDRYVSLYDQIAKQENMGWLIEFLQKTAMDNNPDEGLHKAYKFLADTIKGKDYYVITTTIDDYVYNCGLENDRIVTPCGGYRKLQCSKACTNDLTKVPNALLQYVQKLYNNKMSLEEMKDKFPECPFCGANLVFNQIGTDKYVETGYMPGWVKYKEWIEKTMNRRTVLLELGAGLGFMSVIRSPFERITGYNRKATMYRVHKSLYMSTPQMEDRCVSIKADPVKWVTDIAEE